MINRNGEPVIPPYPMCPAVREGEPFQITPEKFELFIVPDVYDQQADEFKTVVKGAFEHENHEPDNFVAVGTVELQVDSLDDFFARQIYAFRGRTAVDEKAGEIFCERIKVCRGLTENGECWALGNAAMAEVFRQIAE